MKKLAVWASRNYNEQGPFKKLLKGCIQRAGYDAWRGSNVTYHLSGSTLCSIPIDATGIMEDDRQQLLLGKETVKNLLGWDFTGKGCAIQDIRGSMLPLDPINNRWGILTIPPEMISVGYDGTKGKAQSQYYPLLINDIRRASDKPFVPKVTIAKPLEVAEAFALRKIPYFSLDIEGADGKPNLVGVGWEKDHAYVIQWKGNEEGTRLLLQTMFANSTPILHNASYDIPELMEAGVAPPTSWVDTINTSALINPEQKKALQAQVLSYVPGSITWKGLINHEHGPGYVDKKVGVYRDLWTEVLCRLGRKVPSTPTQWYCFYNGLDVAYTYCLAEVHTRILVEEGRYSYYENIMQPIQAPLVFMGLRPVPCNVERLAFHRKACQRLVDRASEILGGYGWALLLKEKLLAVDDVITLENLREVEKKLFNNKGKFSQARELTKARTRLNTANKNCAKGFNAVSPKQRTTLLYKELGLPETKKNWKAKGPSSDEKSLLSLRSRLIRGTIKIKHETLGKDDGIKIINAMLAATKWSTWKNNFLNPPLKDGGMITAYSQHRANTGRISSGVDSSDPDKGIRGKVQQLQNVPKPLRDIVVAPEGFKCIGADWSNIEWAITMWLASKVPYDFVRNQWIPDPKRDEWYCHNMPKVIAAYNNGYFLDLLEKFQKGDFDAHRYLASFAFDKPESDISSNERTTCKPYTHGYNFDGKPSTLAKEADQPIAVGVRTCQAHDVAFMSRPWKEWTVQEALSKRYVQTPAGWRRYFWALNPKPTEILGTKVQATAADLMKWVMANIAKKNPAIYLGNDSDDWNMITTTHDSLMLMVPNEEVGRCKMWLQGHMEAKVPWLDNRSWRADIKVGQTWRAVS